MQKYSKLALAAILSISLAISANADKKKYEKSYGDKEIGLAHGDLEDENEHVKKESRYGDKAPGTSKKIPRAYDNAPPMIPHSLDGLVPITKESNSCTGCHMPQVAKAVNAVAIPPSHLKNLRNGEDLKGELYQGRYNCTQCHEPQAVGNPLVKNGFKGEFKTKDAKHKSNLMETINEGVEAEEHGHH